MEKTSAEILSRQKDIWERLKCNFTPEEADEITDAAERLEAPSDHSVFFSIKDGDLHCETAGAGKGMTTICEEALAVAMEAAKTNPNWAVEAWRRRLELEEIRQVLKMDDGQKLVISPTPDAVLERQINIGGYNFSKKTTMLRLWRKNGDELSCRYVSLDGGNKRALQCGLDQIGIEIADNAGSEELLAQKHMLAMDAPVIEPIVRGYDATMAEQFGGEWNYGTKALGKEKALELVMNTPRQWLMDLMGALQNADARTKETLRYDFAAMVMGQVNGKKYDSMTAAGAEARENGVDYSGYCPTAPVNNSEALNQIMGRTEKWVWKQGFCRVKGCAHKNHLTEVGPCMVCRDCQDIYDAGGNPAEKYEKLAAETEARDKKAGKKVIEIVNREQPDVKKPEKPAQKEEVQEEKLKITWPSHMLESALIMLNIKYGYEHAAAVFYKNVRIINDAEKAADFLRQQQETTGRVTIMAYENSGISG